MIQVSGNVISSMIHENKFTVLILIAIAYFAYWIWRNRKDIEHKYGI
jgi:hypothetical protein